MREFRQSHGRTGERYWKISFEAPPGQAPETVVTEWGAIKSGKKKKHGGTKNRPGPKGKKNTRAYMNAADNAIFNMDRLIRKKTEEGYIEVGLDGRPLTGGVIKDPQYETGPVINFHEVLPKNLCFSKPKNTVTEKFIRNLEEKDNIILTRKMNGMMIICQISDEQLPVFYSRRMDEMTDHFPHLYNAMLNLKIPAKSILLFEAFLGEGNKKKDLLRTQSVMRSKTERALLLQEEDEWMKFYLLRIPVWKGSFLEQDLTCEQMCELIENTFSDTFIDYRDSNVNGQFLFPLEVFNGTVNEARAESEKYGYEGWVGYKRDAVMGKYSFSFHGKPDRPSCAFKMKPEYEDDFIAFFNPDRMKENTVGAPTKEGSWGTGKNTGLLGTMSLYQQDPETGEIIYICEVGSGFTDADRKELSDPSLYPMCVTVKFTSRQYMSEMDDTNALEFPRFDQVHPDKDWGEVFNPKIKSQ